MKRRGRGVNKTKTWLRIVFLFSIILFFHRNFARGTKFKKPTLSNISFICSTFDAIRVSYHIWFNFNHSKFFSPTKIIKISLKYSSYLLKKICLNLFKFILLNFVYHCETISRLIFESFPVAQINIVFHRGK